MDTVILAPATETGLDVRRACRSGGFEAPTPGLAPGYVQANLAILPHDWAMDFMRYCQSNPRPCPLLGGKRPAHGGRRKVQGAAARPGDRPGCRPIRF